MCVWVRPRSCNLNGRTTKVHKDWLKKTNKELRSQTESFQLVLSLSEQCALRLLWMGFKNEKRMTDRLCGCEPAGSFFRNKLNADIETILFGIYLAFTFASCSTARNGGRCTCKAHRLEPHMQTAFDKLTALLANCTSVHQASTRNAQQW